MLDSSHGTLREEPSAVPKPLAGEGTAVGSDRVDRQKRSVLLIDTARRAFRSWWPSNEVVPSNKVARRRWGPAALMKERARPRSRATKGAPSEERGASSRARSERALMQKIGETS